MAHGQGSVTFGFLTDCSQECSLQRGGTSTAQLDAQHSSAATLRRGSPFDVRTEEEEEVRRREAGQA